MKLHADMPSPLNTVTAYGPDWIEINRRRFDGAVVVMPEGEGVSAKGAYDEFDLEPTVPADYDAICEALRASDAAAVRGLDAGQSGVMVSLGVNGVDYVGLEEVAGHIRNVPMDCDTLQTGRDLGISFGD